MNSEYEWRFHKQDIPNLSKLCCMQSKTEEITSELKTVGSQKTPKSFTLYEEYSQCNMHETIRIRKNDYERATREERNQLEKQVEAEVATFCKWLEETKNLKPYEAHYCAISLKSLLLGLPTGMQIAQLFSTVLDS